MTAGKKSWAFEWQINSRISSKLGVKERRIAVKEGCNSLCLLKNPVLEQGRKGFLVIIV